MDEASWTKLKADASLFQTIKAIPEQINYGAANDDADCSAEFVLGWDATYFYCASWYHDDIHYTPRSKDVTSVLESWQDDGHEWWIDVDYADIVADQIPEYYGNYGWQMMQGFNLTSGTPDRIVMAYYHDEMGAAAGYGVTTAVAKQKGFDVPYTTSDGLNFSCEASFKWASDLMNQKGTAANGDEIAFNLGANDDDNGLGYAGGNFCYLSWTGAKSQGSLGGWGKVTLVSTYKDLQKPIVSIVSPNNNVTWYGNELNNIQWTATDNIGVVARSIHFSTNDGIAWIRLDTATTNTGTWAWTVPIIRSSQCRVKVMAYDSTKNCGYDTSDVYFTINKKMYFTCSETLALQVGTSFGKKLQCVNTTGSAVTCTYLYKPSWLSVSNDSVYGIAPSSVTVDSFRVVGSVSGVNWEIWYICLCNRWEKEMGLQWNHKATMLSEYTVVISSFKRNLFCKTSTGGKASHTKIHVNPITKL